MRVIAGKYKGRVLKGPKHKGVRPTADRVKEALFNIIGTQIEGADFLDLFAGTGAIGIEAFSRGAAAVIMVDENSQSIKLIQENCRCLDEADRARVLHLSSERALMVLTNEGHTFDLIFLDPPFEAGLLQKTIQSIARFELLKSGGWLIAEHPRLLQLSEVQLTMGDTRYYGDICLTFFKKDSINQ